jgi:hypothetical protein
MVVLYAPIAHAERTPVMAFADENVGGLRLSRRRPTSSLGATASRR